MRRIVVVVQRLTILALLVLPFVVAADEATRGAESGSASTQPREVQYGHVGTEWFVDKAILQDFCGRGDVVTYRSSWTTKDHPKHAVQCEVCREQMEIGDMWHDVEMRSDATGKRWVVSAPYRKGQTEYNFVVWREGTAYYLPDHRPDTYKLLKARKKGTGALFRE